MHTGKVLQVTAHRPWPLPRGPWVMAQTWSSLLFAHWPMAPEALRPLVPAALPLDTYEGQAWVGIVPFQMSDVYPRGARPVPWLSAFPELNVRTYVTPRGRPGVYFFSLDAGNPIAVRLARAFFHLPYFDARMRCQPTPGASVAYTSQRTHRQAPPASFAATYRPTGPAYTAAPGTLAHWLTERYCLYTLNGRGDVLRGEIHHRPWLLQPAEADITDNTMARAAGLALPDVPPLLHYAARQEVVVWWPRMGTRSLTQSPQRPQRNLS